MSEKMSETNWKPGETEGGTQVLTRPKARTRTPSKYKVILLNDDFTPMDFVVHILQKFFNTDSSEASEIMLQVHQQGQGVAGVFTYEVAETKCFFVNEYAKSNNHPLKSTVEKA